MEKVLGPKNDPLTVILGVDRDIWPPVARARP
jgi:hypothetical protein